MCFYFNKYASVKRKGNTKKTGTPDGAKEREKIVARLESVKWMDLGTTGEKIEVAPVEHTHFPFCLFHLSVWYNFFMHQQKKTVTLLPLDNIMHEWEKWGIIIVIVIHMYIEDYIKAKCRATGTRHMTCLSLWPLEPFSLSATLLS